MPAATTGFEPLTAPGVRLDSGVEAEDTVGTDFDPMLAKVVARGRDRRDALRRLAGALVGARVHGVGTNRDLLVRVLRHPMFTSADLHTGFLSGGRLTELARPLADGEAEALSALVASVAAAESARTEATVPAGVPANWRNLPSQPHTRRHLVTQDREITTSYRTSRGTYLPEREGTRVLSASPDHVVLEVDGVRRAFTVHTYPGDPGVYVESALGSVARAPVDPLPSPESVVDPGALPAPMPGTVTAADVAVGETVTEGQTLLRMEAMKMEHRITAPTTGAVREIPVEVGQRVAAGALLAVLDDEGRDE